MTTTTNFYNYVTHPICFNEGEDSFLEEGSYFHNENIYFEYLSAPQNVVYLTLGDVIKHHDSL